ncbi:sulfurtransferase complex subunit TusB [Shewanella marina]|uniref:sulfurtransferase complex subunit TusB n=1 Tax=Shewanella marina TaxID=487319 RepID=UPI00046ED5AA|nr:sulfurtransferase complex subunit TusB [Shewanella marina]
MILHTIQTSPAKGNRLALCLRFMREQDSLLLLGDGINSLLSPQIKQQLSNTTLYLLQDDVNARGLANALMQYDMISYEDFVALTISHNKVINW